VGGGAHSGLGQARGCHSEDNGGGDARGSGGDAAVRSLRRRAVSRAQRAGRAGVVVCLQ
jgi:hypothetical protein